MSSLYSHTVTAQAVQKVTLRNSERNPWCGIRCPKLTFVRLTRLNRVLFEKLTVPQLVEKVFAFYGTQRFITHYGIHNSPPRVSILGQINSVTRYYILRLEYPF